MKRRIWIWVVPCCAAGILGVAVRERGVGAFRAPVASSLRSVPLASGAVALEPPREATGLAVPPDAGRPGGTRSGVPLPDPARRALNSWFDYESHLSDLLRLKGDRGAEWARNAVLEATTEFLEFGPETALRFRSTVRGVRQDLKRISEAMGAQLASFPTDLSDQELQRLQAAAEDRFRGQQREALAHLEPFFDGRGRHREFRNFSGVWLSRYYGLEPEPPSDP